MSELTEQERVRVDVTWQMLRALSPLALAEIDRALALTLAYEPTLWERRVTELGPLAQMLDARARAQRLVAPGTRSPRRPRDARQRYPVIKAADYDRERPPDAPSSRELSARFGGRWYLACRAVWGLMDDGRYAGLGMPWVNAVRGKPRIRYTDAERIAAVRACAWRFGRRPSSGLYIRWCTRRHARARQIGIEPPRIPTYDSFRVRYGGWAQTMAAAAITDSEIAHARAELAARNSIVLAATARAGRPIDDQRASARDGFDALTEQELAELGLDAAAARSAALRGFAEMPLSDAARLAEHLGGSLDWLADRQPDPGTLTAPVTRLDGKAVRRARRDAGVSEATLLDAVGCSLSAWRRLLTGRNEPSLELVVSLAGVLDRAAGDLCR